MSKEKIALTNRLVEGFLYVFLEKWKSEAEIFTELLKEYGENVCQPNVHSSSGLPKYQTKIQKCLSTGIRNQVYEMDSGTQKYRRIQ